MSDKHRTRGSADKSAPAGTAAVSSQAPQLRVERALEAREAMRKHRAGKPIAFTWERRP